MEGKKPRRAIESVPLVEAVHMKSTVVVRDQSGPKWYASHWIGHDLQRLMPKDNR